MLLSLTLSLFLIILRPPTSTLFPYTTLFRSIAKLMQRALECAGITAKIIQSVPAGAYEDVPHFVICPQMFERLPGMYVAFQMERSEEHTSELQSRENLVCRLLLEKKKNKTTQ